MIVDLSYNEVKTINYLLLITIAWSSLSGNMSSELSNRLKKHNILSHILILFIIFNMIHDTKGDKTPMESFISAFVVYASFIILVNQKFSVFIVLMVMILIIYMLNVNETYYDQQGELNTKTHYVMMSNFLQYCVILIAIGGFGWYLYDNTNSVDNSG